MTTSSQKTTLGSHWKTVLKDYEFLKVLGKGSSGTVIQARCLRSRRIVAVKGICYTSKSSYALIKLIREITIMKELSAMPENSHTVRLLDVIPGPSDGETDSVFLVMEYAGQTLASKLASSLSLFSEAEITQIIHQLLSALAFLHSAGVIHRDIKPANVLIDDNLELKICDFGLARTHPQVISDVIQSDHKSTIAKNLKNQKSRRKRATRKLSGHVVTRWYRPPEVILLEKEYDGAVDLWSVGCILAEMMSLTADFQEQGLQPQNRILFPGLSCDPLSPSPNREQEGDMMEVILLILGDQSHRSLSFITHSEPYAYAVSCFSGEEKIRFQEEFPSSSPDLCKLLEILLQFNPHFRKTARKLSQATLFNSVRQADKENPSPTKIQLEIDAQGAYNYEDGTHRLGNEKIRTILQSLTKKANQ